MQYDKAIDQSRMICYLVRMQKMDHQIHKMMTISLQFSTLMCN